MILVKIQLMREIALNLLEIQYRRPGEKCLAPDDDFTVVKSRNAIRRNGK